MKKGIVTIGLLLLLSSILLLLLLLDDDILRIHSSIVQQRKNYLQSSLFLQNVTKEYAMQVCNNLPLDNDKKTHQVSLKNTGKFDRTLGFIWCERHFLFKKSPKKAVIEKQLMDYIDKKTIDIFESVLITPSNNLPQNKQPTLYWFPNTTTWEISHDLYAVVIAKGDLNITGGGRIRGSVITKGNLNLGENVKVTYKKSVIKAVMNNYSKWKLAKKSWYDFNENF